MVIERPMQQATFSLVYTPSALTADDVIEQLVAHSSTPSECCVATDDNAERETVAALGAATMRSSELMEWLRRVEARQTAAVQDIKKANTRAWKQP
jgi:predicted RNA-binding protein with PIN domain